MPRKRCRNLKEKARIQGGIQTLSQRMVALSFFQYWLERSREAVHSIVLSTLSSRLQTDVADLGVLSTRLIEVAAAG